MAQFRGSARSSGFDSVTIPDNAQRIREAGQKRIDDLRAAYNQSIGYEKDAINDLRESNKQFDVASSRNDNLQKTYEKTYEFHLRKKYDQLAKNDERRAKQDRDRYDRLSTFSKEAGKLGKEMYEQHKDNRQRMGMALVYRTGLTAEELQTLRRGEDELLAEHTATNAIIQRLKANGASASEIKQIQQLDGWILYGAQKELAKKGGDAFRAHLASPEVRNKKYELPDGRKLSLESALEYGEAVDYKTVRGIISANFLDRYKGYDLAFAEEYLFPDMREVEANDDISFNSKAQKAYEKEQAEIFSTNALNALDEMSFDPHAVEKFLLTETGGMGGRALGIARQKFLDYLVKGYQDGSITDRSFLASLQDQQLTISGKTVTFGEQFLASGSGKAALGQMTAALRQQDSDDFQAQKLRERIFVDKLEAEAFAQSEGDGYSDAEVEAHKKALTDKNIRPSETLLNLMSKRSLGIDRRIQYEQAMATVHDTELSKSQLRARFPDLSASDIETLHGISSNRGSSGGSGLKDYTDELVQDIKSVLESSNKIDPGSQTVGMTRIMKKHFAEDVAEKLADKEYAGYGVDRIAQLVKTEHKAMLKEGKGIYQRIMDGDTVAVGDDAGFIQVGLAPQVDSPRYTRVIKAVDADPKVLGSKKLLGDIKDEKSWASRIPSIIETGEPPLWLTELARATGTPWKTFFNKQAALYGDYRLPLSRLEDIREGISPGFMSHLNAASAAAVLIGSTRQARAQGAKGTEVYRPMLNMMASFESSNDTVHDGYDAMNLGGTHQGSVPIGTNTGTKYFQKPLVEMTVGEILDKQAAGQLHAAGRYQFIEGTIPDIFDRGSVYGITRDSKFDARTQDLLAIAYLRLTIRKDYPNNPTQGVRNRWIGVRDHLSYEETQEYVERILQDPRYQGTAFEDNPVDPIFDARLRQRAGN